MTGKYMSKTDYTGVKADNSAKNVWNDHETGGGKQTTLVYKLVALILLFSLYLE